MYWNQGLTYSPGSIIVNVLTIIADSSVLGFTIAKTLAIRKRANAKGLDVTLMYMMLQDGNIPPIFILSAIDIVPQEVYSFCKSWTYMGVRISTESITQNIIYSQYCSHYQRFNSSTFWLSRFEQGLLFTGYFGSISTMFPSLHSSMSFPTEVSPGRSRWRERTLGSPQF